MANFPLGLELTPAGEVLNAKIMANQVPFVLDAIVIGDGMWSGPGLPTTLVNQIYSVPAVSIHILADNIVLFEADLTPLQQLLTDVAILREVGMILVDPDEGPILYKYGNAENDIDTIPPAGGASFLRHIVRIPTRIANVDNLVLNIQQIANVNIIPGFGISLGAMGDQTIISLRASLKYLLDRYITTEGQQVFTPVNTNINGALMVFVEGIAACPDEWAVDSGSIRLAYPLQAGRKVWIQECRIDG